MVWPLSLYKRPHYSADPPLTMITTPCNINRNAQPEWGFACQSGNIYKVTALSYDADPSGAAKAAFLRFRGFE